MAENNSSAPPQQNVTYSIEPDATSTTESSPPPESSLPLSQSPPPPSASPPPPNTPPPPQPSPPPPPSSNNNSSSPNINQSPPPNQNSSSPTGNSPPSPSSSTFSPPPPPPPPPPSPYSSSPPPPSSSASSPPPPSPSSSPPPPPSTPAPSTNSSSPSDSGSSIKSPLTPVPSSGSGSNYPPPPSSIGMSPGSYSTSSGQSNSHSQSPSTGGSGNTATYVGYAVVGVFFVALVAVACVCITRRKRKPTKYNAPYDSQSNFPIKPDAVNVGVEGFYGSQPTYSSQGSNFKNAHQIGNMHHSSTSDVGVIGSQIVFSFDNILEITNGFSHENVIGEGGFGCVYKAFLPDSRVGAVKQLKAGSGQGEREFMAEVEIISRVHHRHLVSLIGYCISEQQRILVYEFVPNKTLDHHLHGEGVQVLDWAKRVKIAIGAAKGLAYLHEDCHPKIIHRDIKSSNILLDDSFEAQVADFGLAKLNVDANTHVTTRVMGTFGYLAPEYATSGKLTDRSDVYSFGVVLLELITGRKPVDKSQPIGDESLVEWARPLLLHAVETGDCSQLIDPKLEGNFVQSEMLRMIEAAAACIRHSAPKRPSMLQVVRALDSREDLSDLSNGVKYGQSIVYNSDRYNADILRLMNNSFGSSEFDIYSGEYNSKQYSGTQNSLTAGSSSGESETRALNKHRFRTQHMNLERQT